MDQNQTRIRMTKGYKGARGVILGKAESSTFAFYVVELENGLRIVIGSSAFIVEEG